MSPYFSIITPVYNSQKYLRKCIESVLEQTYSSWELILIDDGSTDASGKICDSFCNDTRIKVIHQENAGALSSRIRGIQLASGKYQLGLDSDDYLDSNCLETIKKAIDISGSDLIFFGFRLVGRQHEICKCTLASGKIYTQREILEQVIENTNHSLSNKAIRMDKVKQARYFNLKKNLSINLDYAQIISILGHIKTGYVIDDVLYNYRLYESSLSHSCKVQHILDTGYVTEYVLHQLKIVGLLDTSMYDKVYLAYLKMISHRLMRLFANRSISKEDCRMIHKSKVYIRSKTMETLENLGEYNFQILRLFRRRQYWILRWMGKRSF